ncbi:BREX-1 system adenine-specific DNA-methyltransferase PglX [Desulfobacter hydrogenophilus]|uniref:site-specific DNA-methyltransferase (adenine-specific) n=1 Tax=Desulfobacter hydrogenophilus TaxID=2291 RepID=A0A328F791_9BACT|nr:BREX-1 system adenine-specific DNA-methyltransferase PglX [Desulfobacter hydrogenophilus]NDY73876.1 BREX-1 system adenine-specific DNA-methyltransferase PglX [Desulfobacter hydrogenophilus]QBH14729.1 BREX-1 system adenine-specific DNA-methyltransferase PglX [Desulfobacter hydrogenophilus]RAM00428.1 BREX-1 system adenine-specific DNA-methyltransferase PglX [Desulfobacter hydrogenophilus]
MKTAKLKKFAQFARRSLMEQVSAKVKLVQAEKSAAQRGSTEAIKKLEEAINANGKEQVIERVAYIWFNRFCALRFMDTNRYSRIGVVSPAEGQFQPEILAEAKMGYIDEEMVTEKARQQIFALLDGKSPSRDPQGKAYRMLVVAACNFWNKAMPFLFQRIDDYTELLMPEDLLLGNSILAYTREAMTTDVCKDVEVIGWLYQFYISEKKDDVFTGLKKNKKITPDNIPAATQLFTPHYIVRYLMENSLGRLWLLNRPDSKLIKQMDYYIPPAGDKQVETDFLRIATPEDIKICDPACGSGHMLTYAFELLYAIYEEEGYEPAEIPEKILTHNLYGIEIDERAGELAAFALTMKARAKQRRFFNKRIKPNICVLENIRFDEGELKDYTDFLGHDLFTVQLLSTLRQFEEADNFGSLIRPEANDVSNILKTLESKNTSGHLFLNMTHQKVLQALRQADYLSPKYHVVIANPPYMGGKGMNPKLSAWVKDNYPDSKSDLFAMFIERNLELSKKFGSVAMITMQSWMFLSRHEKLRRKILENAPVQDMAHLGTNAFDSISGEVVSTTAFILHNAVNISLYGRFIDLKDGRSENEKKNLLFDAAAGSRPIYSTSAKEFVSITGAPIAYWLSQNFRRNFQALPAIKDVFKPAVGLNTGDNDRFLRQWFEVSFQGIYFSCDSIESAKELPQRWFPYNKGGSYRKWYGNQSFILNWENNGFELKEFARKRNAGKHWSRYIQNLDRMFQECITWSDITTNSFAARYSPKGFLFDVKGSSGIPTFEGRIDVILSLLCSKLMPAFMKCVNPTSTFQVGDLSRVPYKCPSTLTVQRRSTEQFSLVAISKRDWDSYEISWGFTSPPLINPDYHEPTLKATYQKLRAHWQKIALEMQRLEEENNLIFINAYGLQDELTPEVPLNEITLTCNPHYRYGKDKSEEELEALLLADTMRELVSYAVGCMFGRYALEKPGLILANQGESIENYLERISEPRFQADDDNVIPLLNGDWFSDDIAERFRKFLRVTFGEAHYEENLEFVEKALNIKGKRNYSIRNYFLSEFYIDHWKRYKKRPIYWLFSSPKGSFNALIYMHRYRPDTVSVVLNDYLREFSTKLTSHKNHLEAVSISASSSQAEKTRAIKEIEKITKMIAEMEEYEHDVLYPLATEQVDIDLDDGVKVNYPKFGKALKKITGLSK